jgi:mannitol/fructose-specific phosphotransferase system IIA component (Ntr-type)
VDYNSLDGNPVDIAFMLLSTENNVGLHLRLLSKVSRLMNNTDFLTQLHSSKTQEEVFALFIKAEEND